MSASSSADGPVQTVLDLLSGTAAATWPNGTKPEPIEELWETDMRTKGNRSSVAAYVWSSDVGTREQHGASYDQAIVTEVVSVAVWADDDPDLAAAVAGDVVAILERYANDTRDRTTWVTIRPTIVDDRRAEALARRADHHVQVVEVELLRDEPTRTPGAGGYGAAYGASHNG